MSDIRVETADRVLTITLDRPAKKNAITDAMYGAIVTALTQAAEDPSIGAVLLRGEGADFCAGNDISMFADAASGTKDILDSNTGPFLNAISTFPKPLVAAVTGRAIGIGVTMLLHCDLVYVAEDAEMRTPFIDLGLVPEAASALTIPARIGHVRAFALFALGEKLGGGEAATLGIANRALPADQVGPAAETAARALAAKPLSALIATKRLMRDAEAIAAALDADQKAFVAQLKTPEAAAAFAAFAARKGPPA
ncbi:MULTISPECIES: enoyl-CoA hydratase-related protein [unclassified Sphingomonas]|uniref:enoyl-CoA hydratase-related protein n=1 Tax=unclassified Sphingomonas TaxID=196159 RepID=UPI0006F4D732|nr:MULTISPECIES: enoyl-CoA hydratase-related protein [unclassified Sphingomonas]KQX19710.1 enoyl-CoA hydratase [Sphingomonas sp. Root1294]KQY65911.1 enoyl-CoA hydratase [Sphingomonas sp. Root50]KRB95521.1 enoyl-CoA hydratase [Sphingomonas sp. Root720]